MSALGLLKKEAIFLDSVELTLPRTDCCALPRDLYIWSCVLHRRLSRLAAYPLLSVAPAQCTIREATLLDCVGQVGTSAAIALIQGSRELPPRRTVWEKWDSDTLVQVEDPADPYHVLTKVARVSDVPFLLELQSRSDSLREGLERSVMQLMQSEQRTQPRLPAGDAQLPLRPELWALIAGYLDWCSMGRLECTCRTLRALVYPLYRCAVSPMTHLGAKGHPRGRRGRGFLFRRKAKGREYQEDVYIPPP